MTEFFARLTERARVADSLLCVGLDPHPEDLPQASAEAAKQFCLRLIDATAAQACAFKPNSAFFEAFGAQGWMALQEVIGAVPDRIPVILDAKRGDIASTARAYAQAAFEGLGASAITVNPYLGEDAVVPFLQWRDRGVFLLCKTSNPSAPQLQLYGESPLFLQVARLAQGWNQAGNLGLVVGATDPASLQAVRQAAPDLWILAPGVGAQGGDLERALRAGLREDGLGLLLPVSRAIARAADPGLRAEELRVAINRQRGVMPGGSVRLPQVSTPHPDEVGPFEQAEETDSLRSLADDLLNAGCIRFGDFVLKSGAHSPIYIDLRLLAGQPELLDRVAAAYLPRLTELSFDRIAAVPYAALPIATALSLRTGVPVIYPRKEVKGYGTGVAIEGGFGVGETALILDDLITTGGSKLEAAQTLRSAGLVVNDIVVLIDRSDPVRAALEDAGLRLHAVFSLESMLRHWEVGKTVQAADITAARSFLCGRSETGSSDGRTQPVT